MAITGINHRIGIKAPLEKVYEALTTPGGITSWWAPAKGVSALGATIEIVFPQLTMTLKVVGLEPNKLVAWESAGSPAHWTGTRINFELKREGEHTIVLFSHRGWPDAQYEMMAHSSTKWATFLLSLKALFEDGKGAPSPKDRKIDNWN